MIFGFIKHVQENISREAGITSSTETYSEADQSALMASYEDAVLICESLEASMVRSALASTQLFGESVNGGSEELYIASLFDKAKGLFVSIWKVIVDAFKAVTNWIKGLFGKVTKATSKNLEQIDKLAKLATLKNGDLGVYGTDWSVPQDFKIEYKSSVIAMSAAMVGYTLWSKNKFDSLKLNADYTAGAIFKDKMQKGVTDAIVGLLSNDDTAINDAAKKPIKDAATAVETVVNALRGNNQAGFTGEGAERKAKQLKFFLNGLLFASPETFFNASASFKNRAVGASASEVDEMLKNSAVALLKSKPETFADIVNGKKTSADISSIIQANMIDGISSLDQISKKGTITDAVSLFKNYIQTSISFAAGRFMDIPEDSGDVKAYLIKNIFDDRIGKTLTKETFEEYYLDLNALIIYVNAWTKEFSIKTVQANFAEGEKFFSNIAKEYQVIYDQMKKVVGNNTNISGKPNMTELTNSLNGMVRGAGELTSWFTTGIIQTYAIGDMMTTKGFSEVLGAINKYAEIQEKIAIKVA